MALSRRGFLSGSLAGVLSVGLGSSLQAHDTESLIGRDINVQEAMDLSQDKIILHCGREFNSDVLQSIKYAIEELGMFEVDVYGGGPPDMVTSYVMGHNYPGRHYTSEKAQEMIEELRELVAMHEMALENNPHP